MIPVFANSCNTLIQKWEQAVGPQGTCEIDIWPEFQDLAGEIISRTASGCNYEEGKKILELQTIASASYGSHANLMHSWF